MLKFRVAFARSGLLLAVAANPFAGLYATGVPCAREALYFLGSVKIRRVSNGARTQHRCESVTWFRDQLRGEHSAPCWIQQGARQAHIKHRRGFPARSRHAECMPGGNTSSRNTYEKAVAKLRSCGSFERNAHSIVKHGRARSWLYRAAIKPSPNHSDTPLRAAP